MGKWFGRILYAIVLILVTFFMTQSAFDARSNAYLLEKMDENWNDEDKFFIGINTLLDLDYITADPIIPAYVDDSLEHQLTFQLFGIGYTDQEGNHLNGLMIFVNDLRIYEEDADTGFLKEVENPYIRLTVYTDEMIDGEPVSFTGFEGQNFSAGFIFDEASEEIAYDLTKEDGTLATITRVDVDYSNGASNGSELVYATESLMIVSDQQVDDPVFDDSLKISNFSYDTEDYRLQDDITTWPITDAEATTLNLFTEHDNLSDYNGEIVRVYVLYGLFVLVITYLLFFHKKTMAMIRARRAVKHPKDDSKKEIIETDTVEQIFKDRTDKEDGK